MAIGPRAYLLIGGILALAAPSAQAQDFHGKTLRIVVGWQPGGGNDQYARLMARFMSKHLQGNPSIIIQNMPGAGTITAMNSVANSPKDGSVMGLISRNVPVTIILSGDQMKATDPRSLTWIGSSATDTAVCIAASVSGVKALDDLASKELVVGGVGGAGDSSTYPRTINAILGTKFKVVDGYQSSNEVALAMARNEVHGVCTSYATIMRDQGEDIRSGKYNIILQAGLRANPSIKASFIMDAAKTDDQKRMLEFVFASQAIGRPFIAPPDLPPAIVGALRAAFNAAVTDPDYLSEVQKQNLEYDPSRGEDLEHLIKRLYDAPPALRNKMRDLLSQT